MKGIVLRCALILLFLCVGVTEVFSQTTYFGVRGISSSPGELTDSMYVQSGIGRKKRSLSFQAKDGMGVALIMGRSLTDYLRGETEISYCRYEYDRLTIKQEGESAPLFDGKIKGNGSVWSLTGNGYLDLKNSTPFTPYLTVGLGLGGGSFKAPKDSKGRKIIVTDGTTAHELQSKSGIGLAYQAGVGVAYTFNENFSFDLVYKYFGVLSLAHDPEEQFNNGYKVDKDFKKTLLFDNAPQIYLGIRYNFSAY